MTPDVRANGVKIVAVKEVADMSSTANKDLALTFQTVANNTATERLRITSGGTLESYSPDDTTPNIKWRSNVTNWFGALNQSVEGGTITSFLSCGGDWSANGTTYSATKALAAYPTSAIAIHNQYNSSWGSEFVFLTKAGGSSTTDGAVSERLRIGSGGGHKITWAEGYYAANLTECNDGRIALNINQTRSGQTKAIAIGAVSGNSVTGIQCYDTSNNSANNLILNPFGGNMGLGTNNPTSDGGTTF